MSQTFRILAPAVSKTINLPSGPVTSTPGQTLDVQAGTQGAYDGWIPIALSGTTAQRPTQTQPSSGAPFIRAKGLRYLDTTLGAIVTYDGAMWRDVNGNAV
jgi:hypothetical protein